MTNEELQQRLGEAGWHEDWHDPELDVSIMKGRTIIQIDRYGDDALVFSLDDGRKFLMFHQQDCCECVTIESIVGDLADLIGTPLRMAECVSNKGEESEARIFNGSCTWTFYKFATIKGYVDLRWYGTSNGYYSEEVDFVELHRQEGSDAQENQAVPPDEAVD